MVVLKLSYFLLLLLCGGGVLSTQLCLTGDFDSQLRHLLSVQMGSTEDPEQIISRILNDVRDTLSQRWQGFKLIPFGSLIAGISTKSSDLDISFRLPNLNYSSSSNIFEEAKQLFQQQATLYTDIFVEQTIKYLRCSFKHIPTKRNVDLVFHLSKYSEEGVETSKLFKYLFNLDKRNNSLVRFLTYLFNTHEVASDDRQKLVNYLVYMLLIFYLQQKNMAPPVYVLQKDSEGIFVDNWDVSFNELPYRTKNDENLYQLIGGFFKFYSKFNFDEYIVSPYTGRAIPRSVFIDGYNPHEEFSLDNYFNRTTQFSIGKKLKCADLCILGVFLQDFNEAGLVTQENVIKFKYFLKSVAEIFKDLPNDRVLRAILVVDENKETITKRNNSAVDGMNDENCIEVSNM
ncbi:hypothetical protein PYW08_004290 [Mythimna loreyi]|uniref:Uncharacterized protein n=1 Tax=Mythimna loreyi TaxID=667449 RepID=A0ACC2QNP7_9NEOP|nr:hypothetical protein PYW08_004290 [Mythimna loreyi]